MYGKQAFNNEERMKGQTNINCLSRNPYLSHLNHVYKENQVPDPSQQQKVENLPSLT